MKHLIAAAALALAASTATAQDLPCLSPEQTPHMRGTEWWTGELM